MFRTAAALAALAFVLATPAARADAPVQPYGANDAGGFHDILPPGTNGLDDAVQLGAFEATGARPEHSDDQRQMYSDLTAAAPNIPADQLGRYFKDSTFGVMPGDVESTEHPRDDVTIVRDKAHGVPHVYGSTRAGLMFGTGYATAEDRLFFIDVLRHAGRGQLAGFAGGANVAMDEEQWAVAPYTEQDRQDQVDYIRDHLPDGAQISADFEQYVAGINAYITAAKMDPTKMPGEYAAIGKPMGPDPFTQTDLVSIASLVGGIFGKGGGGQLGNATLAQAFSQRFAGAKGTARQRRRRIARARAAFLDFREADDPEAPTTIHDGTRFRYQQIPKTVRRGTTAMPDVGSVVDADQVVAGAEPAGTHPRKPGGAAASRSATPAAALLAHPRSASNALLVSAQHSASGHPIAVMGPQVGYFTPQILMEEDLHGPGIDARGAAFAGVNLYVELGRGRDYAWSATSAGQSIIDVFALPLCDPAGGAVTKQSTGYLDHGQCVAMDDVDTQESWSPNLADSTPAGSITLRAQRTRLGLVIARGTVHGRPVAFTSLRSTYRHELDSVQGFEQFNEPDRMRNPLQFQQAASHIGYTFNWFYVDDQHIAYFNSGDNPVRAKGTNPLFPVWGTYPWKGFDPAANTADYTPFSQHPQIVDQDYLTSWNNKQAPGFANTNSNEFSSVFRSQLLDDRIKPRIAHGGKMSLIDLVNAMGDAGTVDLRADKVIPYALAIIGTPADPAAAGAADALRAWIADGSHRIDRANTGHYAHEEAIRILDAWWPGLVRAVFEPVLGKDLLAQVEAQDPINDEPGHGTSGEHLGSAWDVGFYGVVQKDLRTILHKHVRGRFSRVYCGAGRLAACRAALTSSLAAAAGATMAQVYPADKQCAAGDQRCSDSIQFRALGAVTQPLIPWVNRPTYQQADEIQSHGPR